MENSIQYLAIIKPDKWVMSDAMRMKIQCKNLYGWHSSPPHFTVLDIIQPASNEERLIKCFERNISNVTPFQIHLCGFDYFSTSTYTLYMKLKDEKEFSEMAKYIRKFLNPILKSVKGYPPHYTTKNPHLTIAKGILESEFKKVWPSWENLEYQSSTLANCILLLRRPFTYDGFKYETVGKYPLLGKGLLNTQLTLF